MEVIFRYHFGIVSFDIPVCEIGQKKPTTFIGDCKKIISLSFRVVPNRELKLNYFFLTFIGLALWKHLVKTSAKSKIQLWTCPALQCKPQTLRFLHISPERNLNDSLFFFLQTPPTLGQSC